MHNTRPFSKTHTLILAMEGADKEKQVTSGQTYTHIHNTRPFSKTHLLILAMEKADKEKNRLRLVKHTHIHNTRLFNETHLLDVSNGERRQGEKQVISGQTYTHAQHKTI